MSDSLPWIADEMVWLAEQRLLRQQRTILRQPGGWCLVDGRRLRDFASNDYLGLSQDPRVIAAGQKAAAECGFGSGGSQLVVGHSPWHAELEARLAAFEGQEAAILFPTGYAANVGTLTALAEPGDLICSDRLNHASLIDGCRLSRASIYIYDHDRLDKLEAQLLAAEDVGRKLIVTDAVFSMDGILAPLREICSLAEKYGADVIVDEAHATGVFGERGRGVCELLGVEDRVALRVGTLSKAIGSIGGFVTGRRKAIDWLWNRARTQVFSTAAPPAACAAACAALDIIASEPGRREKLLMLSQRLREGLRNTGYRSVPGGVGPIVPVFAGPYDAKLLEENGFLVGFIRPPSVPVGTTRLRIGVMATHEAEDIDRLLAVFEEADEASSISTYITLPQNPDEADAK